MSRRLKLAVGALAVVVVVTLGSAGLAFAAGPDEGRGLGARLQVCSEEASKFLGLTREEIEAQRHEGKSLVQIAVAKGVSEATLTEAVLAAKKEQLQNRVAEGSLTQERADQVLEQIRERVSYAVNRTETGPAREGAGACCGEPGLGTGPGEMRHWGQQGDIGASYGEYGLGTGPDQMRQWGRGTK